MAGAAEQAAWVKDVLGIEIPEPSSTAASPLDVWIEAKERLDEQVGALQKAFRGLDHPLAKKIADRGLAGFAGNFQVGLQAALMQFQSAAAADRPKRAADVRKATARLRDTLAGSPALPLLERNPLGCAVDLRSILSKAADHIDALAIP